MVKTYKITLEISKVGVYELSDCISDCGYGNDMINSKDLDHIYNTIDKIKKQIYKELEK